MSYRQLLIAKKAHISIEDHKISVKQEEHTNLIPLDDVTIVIIDHREITFSSYFFSACAKNQIAVMVCGENHIPASLSNSINQHYRPLQVIEYQINLSEDMKAMLAEQLLKAKVSNQLEVIRFIHEDEKAISLLTKYIEEIEGMDEMNREGTAAKVFFNSL